MTLALGIDIGGTKIAAAVVDARGGLRRAPVIRPTPSASGAHAIVAAVLAAAGEALGGDDVRAVGIGSAGVFDRHGAVTSATDLLPGWTGTPLAALVGSALGTPAIAVNDVHAAAAGEALVGAGAGHPTMLMVAVGTGVGGAIARDGRVDIGASGSAGSIGHIGPGGPGGRTCSCGATDHVEPWVSGPGLERSYAERTGERRPLREIARSAAAGDAIAALVITEGAELLGAALGAAANLVDPAVIVLGGGVAGIGEPYRADVAASFARHALPGPAGAPVLLGRLGADAAIVGAALLALRD